MIVLFTDFGVAGPYVGQVKAVLWGIAPDCPIVDLFADAPAHSPKESSYLLAAYAIDIFPPGTIFLCVVDPGVGSDRPPVAAKIDGRWFVAPGNGLLEQILRRGRTIETFVIEMPRGPVSPSFHGRDVFAPVAGRLAMGLNLSSAGLRTGEVPRFPSWPDDLASIIYIDHFGNLLTGLRAAMIPPGMGLRLGNRSLRFAHTFSDVLRGEAFWYENANGLVEIAVNCGRAASLLGGKIGDEVQIVPMC